MTTATAMVSPKNRGILRTVSTLGSPIRYKAIMKGTPKAMRMAANTAIRRKGIYGSPAPSSICLPSSQPCNALEAGQRFRPPVQGFHGEAATK